MFTFEKELTFIDHFGIVYLWTLKKQTTPKNCRVASVMQPGKAFSRSSETLRTFMSATPKTAAAFSRQSSGSQRRAQPGALYPKFMDIGTLSYRRFGRWCDAGVFQALHEHFHDAGEVSAILVDSTTVRAHSCAAGAPPQKKAGKKRNAWVGAGAGSPRNSIFLSAMNVSPCVGL